MRMHFQPSVDIDRAIAELRALEVNSRSIGSPGSHPADFRDECVRWANQTEEALRAYFVRSDVAQLFAGQGHRNVCSMPVGNQLGRLIQAELEARSHDFGEIARELDEARRRMKHGPGCPTVVDTNVLLQCQRPDQVPWDKIIGEPSRLMVPLRVIEEIDTKKWGQSDRLRALARDLLPWVEKLFPDGGTGPVSLRDRVTIEVLLADSPRLRPEDADAEILSVCREVGGLAGRVRLLTLDTAMRIRARAEKIETMGVPEEYWRPRQP